MSQLVCKVVNYAGAVSEIELVRRVVFQEEQGVDPTLDFDGLDEAAIHLVALQDNRPIGTARIRYLNSQLAKIERVAVLSDFRGQGVGKALMEAAITFLDQQGLEQVKLNSQVHAKGFYEKLGFEQWGEAFEEAGIPHVEMRRSPNKLKP